MPNLLTRLFRREPEITRYTVNDYIQWLASNGRSGLFQPYGMSVSYSQGRPAERIENSFEGYTYSGYKANPIVFGCMTARSSVFSEARFMWRRIEDGRPGDLFTDDALEVLRKPWPNGTTGELLSRMIQDVDLAGNFYAVNEGDRLRRLRPDWVQIVLTGDPRTDLDVDVFGYVYTPGGPDSGNGRAYMPDEVCHWSPIPDPDALYRGMSWLTPVVREIQGDSAAVDHKIAFFRNGATLGPIVKVPAGMTATQFKEFVDASNAAHQGVDNAYRPMYVGGGADVTLQAATMQQLDFKALQGASETRICVAARVPAVIAGVSEGLAGSSLNAGNYGTAKRSFADGGLRPLWRSACAALMAILDVPEAAELWYDERDIAFLRDDEQDIAQIQQTQASTISSLITAGFKPESSVSGVVANDFTKLEHTGLTSVQLMPPGSQDANGDGMPDAEAEASDEYQQALEEFRSELEPFWDEIARGRPHPGQRYRHGWIPVGLTGQEALAAAGARLSDRPAPDASSGLPVYDLDATLTFTNDPGWKPSSHEASARALRLYRNSTYKKLGPYMRREEGAAQWIEIRESPGEPPTREDLGTHAALIIQAMEEAPLSSPVELWRGIYEPEKVFGDAWRPDGDMTGAEWDELSFSSTSADPSVAQMFASGGALMRLHVPAGVGAIQLEGWRGDFPNHNREAEVLLQSHLRMRVIGDHEEQMGTRTGWERQPDGSEKMVKDIPIIRRVLDVQVEVIPDDE